MTNTAEKCQTPLRVAFYTDARGRGGAEISLGNLLGALGSAVEPTVIGVDPQVVEWIAARRTGTRALVVAEGIGGLPAHLRAFRRLRPHVVHVNRCVPWACSTGIAAALLTPGTRTLTVDQLPLRTTDAMLLWRTRALALRTDALVAVGAASARRMEDFYALGRGSVRSVPNCVPAPAGAPRPRRGGDGTLRIAALGRLDAMKAHDVLLRALVAVPGAEVTIFGEGDARQALETLARELGVADRVTLPGWVEDARARLADFDVLAMPSRSEGFPLAVVEAMLCGLPVVATPVGSVPEAVLDGQTGLVVPSDDPESLAGALVRLRDDVALRRGLGRRGRELARSRFTVEAMAQAYLRLWREIAAQPRRPRLRVPAPKP